MKEFILASAQGIKIYHGGQAEAERREIVSSTTSRKQRERIGSGKGLKTLKALLYKPGHVSASGLHHQNLQN